MPNAIKLNVLMDAETRKDILILVREQVAFVLERKVIEEVAAKLGESPALLAKVESAVSYAFTPDSWGHGGKLVESARTVIREQTAKLLTEESGIGKLIRAEVSSTYNAVREELKGYIRANFKVLLDEAVKKAVVEELQRRLS